LNPWLELQSIDRDIILDIHGSDLYDSHTALRHLHDIDTGEHSVLLILPMSLRKHKAFTPWLCNGKTQCRLGRTNASDIESNGRRVSACVLEMRNLSRHVHSRRNDHAHFASFDMRVAGAQVRTLLDTGATCSCVSSRFATRLGLHWNRDTDIKEIGGVGGEVSVLGAIESTVKLGKRQIRQVFLVIKDPIAGYDCLLGQDFLRSNCGGIFFTEHSVNFALGCNEWGNGHVVFSRRLIDGITSDCQSRVDSLPTKLLPCEQEIDDDGPASHKVRRKMLHEVASGLAVGYTVVIKKVEEQTSEQPEEVLPSCVQAVIDKHSQPGGTLCGKIPDHTHARKYQCHIELQDGAQPVHIKQYRLTPKEKEELEEKVDSFIKKGWIEPSNSSWCSSVLFVPKPNNKLRFCVDFRALNARTVLDRGNIPHQTELLDSLRGAKVFSALDLASGYYQLELDEQSRPYTAFPTPYGLYQWKVMPMGLTNAPAIFQRAMNEILHEHIRAKYCRVYLDDIIILSQSIEEHARHLDAVLADLTKYHLFCQLPKCVWAKEEITYLGHLVDGKGVKPDPAKVTALEKWEPPLDQVAQLDMDETSLLARKSLRKQIQHECRRFLGFMNYFSRFIPRYSDVAAPLSDQTKDDAPDWSDECTRAWNSMKVLLVNATMMYHPDPEHRFHVYSDASIRAIGGVLIQVIDGKIHPVAFAARKLIPAEVNYSTTEQEMLAVVYCFSQWRCYLEGPVVTLHTDHEPLTWLQSQKSLNRRQARWMEFLSRFQYEIVYVKGDENVVADALTRNLSRHDGASEQLPCENWPLDLVFAHGYRSTGGRRSSASGPGPVRPGTASPTRADPLVRHHRAEDAGARQDRLGTPETGEARASATRGVRTVAAAASGATSGLSLLTFVAAGGHTRARARAVGGRIRDGSSRGGIDGTAHSGSTKGGEKPATDAVHDVGIKPGDRIRLPSCMKRTHSEANRQTDMSSTCDSVRGDRNRKKLRVHWGLDENGTSAHGTRCRDVDTPCPPYGEYKRPSPSPRSDDRVDQSVEPDQPAAPDSLNGPDQSLSSYETLLENMFTRIRRGLTYDTTIASEQQLQRLHLTWRDDLVWLEIEGKPRKLYVPEHDQLRQDILYWHHDVPWCAHLGIGKTLELVKRQFWWPKMDIDIKHYIDTCYKCQANKPDRRNRRVPLTPLIPPSACWRIIGVDMIVDLPISLGEEFNAIIVFMCHLSKMVRIIPTHTSLDAKGLAQLFIREIFPHYGMPLEIISDRGTQWSNEYFQALCDEIGIKLKMSTAYHPQTNGLVERTNEVIATALRHFVAADQKDWPSYLPFIEFALNDMYRESIQSTAFRMNRISLPRNPFAAITQLAHGGVDIGSELSGWMGISKLEDGQRTALESHERFSWARKCVHMAKDRMKERHDRDRGSNVHLYEVGQLVWLNVKNISIRHPTLRQKLLPKFLGPIKVIEVVGRSAVKLDLPAALKVHPTISVSLIKPFMARAGIEVPPVVINGELEWELEAIINHHVVKSKKSSRPGLVEFKVRWKGDYEDSWHELEDFENGMESIETYLNNHCTKQMRKTVYQTINPEHRQMFSTSFRREMEIQIEKK
jgi:RNase H-like domain found in reverse transcriptase/Reverse transcriptase (RNA-dependent DNA polymerase)/Integrase zinc binding domain/gag-polyprotein putative aspartyl protease